MELVCGTSAKKGKGLTGGCLRLHGRNYALLARTRSLLAWGPWVPRLLAPTAQRALRRRYRDL